MEILKGSMSKFFHRNSKNAFSSDDEKPFSSLFRRTNVSFYDDIYTEAVFLLEKECQPINNTMRNYEKCISFHDDRTILDKQKRQEFHKIDEIINNINYLDSLKKKVYNIEFQNIIEPLGIYIPNKKTENNSDRINGNIYKEKFEVLKKKYNALKENIDKRIDLELIKSGAFYNKEDIKDIFYMARKQQSEINTKKNIIKVQSTVIENIVEHNKLNKKKLRINKKKNQKLTEMCKFYYEQNEKIQMRLRKIKYTFLEYRIALENIVSCCERIGGDKIILMDGIKSARAQTDLSNATKILNMKKIEELQNNIKYCEQQINSLKHNLNCKLKELSKESKEKNEAKNETLYYKEELTKNNNLLTEVLEDFHRVLSDADNFLHKDENINGFKKLFNNRKKKYNELVKKASERNKELKKRENELILANIMKKKELKKHEEYLTMQIKEMKKKEEDNKKIEEEKLKNEEEIEKKMKEEQEKKTEELKEQQINEGTIVDKKIRKVKKLMEEKNIENFTYEECVDIIYKANLALTENKLSELKSKGDISKDELIIFIKSIVLNEEEALQNMITFFEIWDVQKTGYMHKDLLLFILKQFGDNFTEEEANFLQRELNLANGSNISYVDLLKRWIHGDEKEL
ncbi:myosin light chain B, putative [Plasmodium gallinaceum]|uniref:Myosin light chain B, putative n=1 Tax=Plasmodium gallinaceum TaxID=5849 RepID=A0A1J1GYZ1_PLAGA|nr:myosin light chain B, putative [Plasmodium gallinaceum]CRG96235.1 myosin light chain B, putative [Plasmodium gallinaceum]